MPDPSAAIVAAVRAVRGESDLDAVLPALANRHLAQVIACAPDAHPVVGAVAALCGELSSLLAPPMIADPALHDAVARLIGTPAGRTALRSWAEIAPAGWGRAHAAALRDAVHANMCNASAAAALIGPCDASAALLHDPFDAAFAVRRWGQSASDDPTAWTGALSPRERQRLIDDVQSSLHAIASCLPWLPPDAANRTRFDDMDIGVALDAFADASPTARARHATVLRRLVERARTTHLAALTRLACALREGDVVRRVQTLVRESPADADLVVAAAPWDDLPDDVRAAILTGAATSDECDAVAAARGRRDAATVAITGVTAAAFFAALNPAVWDALDAAAQQRWRNALLYGDERLAVRALGLRPDILARATLTDPLVRAARRHAGNEAALPAALFPVALRTVDLDKAYALMSAIPTIPSDPGVFFVIAGGRADAGAIAPARNTLRSLADLALAITIQRSTSGDERARPVCAALQDALRRRTWDDLAPILALLTNAARAAFMPDADALVGSLAHPDRRDALRQTLDRLADLPPEVAVPTHVALKRRATWQAYASDAAEALAHALSAHGDLFLAMVDALADDLRLALLPPPSDARQAAALRALARDDPVTARRLAHALRDRSRRDAIRALLAAPPRHAGAVWQALAETERHAIVGELPAGTPKCAPRAVHDPLAALALAAVQSDDADLQDAGMTALAARPGMTRTIWEQLPPKVQQTLGALPAFADLPPQASRPVIRRGIRRGRA